MRTVWLILATIVVIVIATAFYTWTQRMPEHHASVVQRLVAEAAKAESPTTTPSDSSSIVQSGDDVWVKVPDKTGQLAWQFRASRYDPQSDGSVNVTKPQAEFFFTGGQIVGLRGTHGHIVIPQDATKGTEMRGAMAPPSRGELYDVTISLYHAANPKHAVLVCKVNNVSFDNDTFRIATESFTDAAGAVVPADQVPVAVRGDDYDFDGRGLVIHWDDRDHRLQSMEIAHGESLTIKSQEALKGVTPVSSMTPSANNPTSSPAPPKPVAKSKAPPSPSRGKKPATLPTTTTKPAVQKEEEPVYRATFAGGVNVTQGDQPLALGDTLQVDFKSENNDSTETGARATPPPTESPSKKTPAVAKTTPAAPTPPPTTQQQPVVIHWPGKLVVVPVETDVPKLEPGQRNIEMVSTATPVVLDHAGSEVHCASFFYGGADDSLIMRNSPQVPIITMKDANGAMLYTPSLKYNGTDQKAYLEGASRAEVPIQNDQTKAIEMMKTKWSESCLLTLAGPSRDQLSIQKAHLLGDVDVDHPKLKLKSETLDVSFAPAATPSKSGSNQLKDLTADGNVRCDMIDDQKKQRHIDTDHLVVTTDKSPSGQLVPKTLTADGNVHTSDEEQDLRAGHLYAKLGPTTRPTDSPQMQSLFAQQNVKFAFKDATGACDQLTADADGDDYNVKLYGQPSATVVQKQSTLTGPIINLQPKRQNVQVVGPGTMHGIQQQSTQSKATPFDIAWGSGLTFTGATNQGEAIDNIVVKTISADGATNIATGDKLTMELMDDPTATTHPTTKPTTRRATSSPLDFDTSNKKQLRTLAISGNTEVKSILNNSRGDLIRRLHLFAPLVRIEAVDKRMVVPSAGRMLYEDLRSTTQPTTAPATPLGDMSGATAFQWDRELIYDQNENRAQLLGNVVVVHQDESGKGEPFRLDSQRVIVDFEPAEKNAPAATPSTESKMKMMTADGNVQFMSRQIRFESDRMTFDTINDRLTAFGTEAMPVEIYDENGVSSAIVHQAWWDTRTQQIGMKDISANMRK